MEKNVNKRKWIRNKIASVVLVIIILILVIISLPLTKKGIKYCKRYIEDNVKYNVQLVDGWKKYSENPILGNEDTGTLFDPNVIIDSDGMYRMYVSWRKEGAIAVTTSTDGINWSELKIVLDKDLTYGWQDIVNRATVIYHNDMYYMWYTGQKDGTSKIGFATSKDGYNFESRREPVLEPKESYETESVMNPYVLYDEDGNIFKMWYAAGETYEPDVLAYATSYDGINWNRYENNPVFTANNDNKALDNYKVGGCDIHKIGINDYIMFYIGYTDIDTARIFIAKSNDGINWVRYSKKPIIAPTKGEFDADACYKPSALYDEKNNRWMVWYNGRNKADEYIGLYMYNKYEI